jgi:hypothetical protein
MRTALMVLVAAFPIGSLSAADVTLRCDPTGSGYEPLLISIDMSQSSIHVGTDQNSGWFSDGARYKYNDGNEIPNIPGSSRAASTACIYDMKQTVSITATTITWGESGVNINACGGHNYDCRSMSSASCRDNGTMPLGVGTAKEAQEYTIYRNTGILTLNGSDRFQCAVFTGKVF